VSKNDAVARAVAHHGARVRHRLVPRRVLAAFDALALHDDHAADPLDGAGIELALEWEWERSEHGVPEGIAREDLVAMTEAPAAGTGRDEEGCEGAGEQEEEAA
jgi:hypothetical protein